MIQSVGEWPVGWTLTLQGPGGEDYVTPTRDLAAPVADRVFFPGAVPLTDMVSVAAQYDVGIFAHQPNGRQASLALPNKLFEYLMAGLAVCVSDMPSMREIVEPAQVGVLIDPPYGVGDVVAAIDRLAGSDIMAFKRAALEAAREHNWERESQAYIAAFGHAFGAPR